MKSHIELIPTKDMSRDEWLAYRMTGIGASEVAVILGLSTYKSSIQLFYEKLGQYPVSTGETLSMFLGKEQEEFIADLWEYWDGDVVGMMQNYRSNTRIRRCKRVNAYARNPKYPWLFVSLDFEINQHEGKGNGALETKTIGGYEADKWEAGFPPGYVMQIMTQCGVCEYEYGESAILRDNRDYNVIAFDFNPDVFNTVVEATKSFWTRVVEGRKLMTQRIEAERAFDQEKVQEIDAALQYLEPEPDASEAYNTFMKERYKIAIPGERLGTTDDLADARAHRDIKSRIKELEEGKQLHENRLKARLGAEGADKLTFGADGFVSWKINTNGARVFLNKVKGDAVVDPVVAGEAAAG